MSETVEMGRKLNTDVCFAFILKKGGKYLKYAPLIMGDMNGKIGEGEDLESGVGHYGLGTRNETGGMLVNFSKAINIITLFQILQ